MQSLRDSYLPKDFIETAEGLGFAVVQSGAERCGVEEKVLCFLRYVKAEDNQWRKVSTEEANAYLNSHYPAYLHRSAILDADLHAVAVKRIIRHHQPKQRLQHIMQVRQHDKVEQDVYELCRLLQQYGLDLSQAGVTGSVLIGAQRTTSDIDLVFYGREVFHKARAITAELVGKHQLDDLDDNSWQEAYVRRSCTLSMPEYVWHGRRKFNNGLINGRKFDLSFVDDELHPEACNYRKLGAITIRCEITDDTYSFDYPALYSINYQNINTVVCFIATYTGQAVIGETVEISGLLEQAEDGSKRIVVGSSREAPGEYIKVIHA
jgi:uncharacterized protein